MSRMSQLFNDSDTDVDIKAENDYAKHYNTWRKKEELNKLKTKYGDADLKLDEDESSSSSEDDEVGIELTEEVEKDFYKTLAQLKKKDPKIYDDSVVFFEKSADRDVRSHRRKNETNESMFIKDYERKLLLEKGGIVSDSDDESRLKEENKNPTYAEEQRALKESLKKAAKEQDSDNDAWGGMFEVRQTDKKQKEKDEADYKAWLVGEKKKLKDEETVASLQPLKEYWSNPNLEDGEKFLRDYMLNKRYLENEHGNYIPTYDEIVHDSDENMSEDEEAIEKQEEFEHKYNFRFEEPDQEFIKRYPRTMENSLRREDNRRKLKRAETKDRKLKEKAEKMEDLRKLRDMKRKEIEEKIEKLKEITGNKEMAFNDEDIDGDFDPEAHDKRMQALFNDDFYEGPEEDQKPKFDLEDEDGLDLEIENFDNWTGTNDDQEMEMISELHCEDDNFIMDADYDPQAATRKEFLESSKKKKKRKRKSKFVEMLASDRPEFNPADKSYEEYIDEYYKLDCEDIIDNIPCRFKYRKVPPNSFGLTVEEVLLAKDRELNKWCSLKKAVQIRPDHVEKYDQIAFSKKAHNIDLKKKFLPSLFIFEEDVETQQTEKAPKKMQNQKNVGNEKKDDIPQLEMKNVPETKEKADDKIEDVEGGKRKKKKKRKQTESSLTENRNVETKDITSDGLHLTSVKKKKNNTEETVSETNTIIINNPESSTKKDIIKTKKKKKRKNNKAQMPEKNTSDRKRKHSDSTSGEKFVKKLKKNKVNTRKSIPEIGMSDARLAAYGLNPKKFKNKKLYGNKQKDK